MGLAPTFRKFFYTDIVELLDLFHDQILLVNLDDKRSTSSIATRETEFP